MHMSVAHFLKIDSLSLHSSLLHCQAVDFPYQTSSNNICFSAAPDFNRGDAAASTTPDKKKIYLISTMENSSLLYSLPFNMKKKKKKNLNPFKQRSASQRKAFRETTTLGIVSRDEFMLLSLFTSWTQSRILIEPELLLCSAELLLLTLSLSFLNLLTPNSPPVFNYI